MSDGVAVLRATVSATAVGKAYNDYGDYKRFDGLARDAKIAFFDISKSAANTSTDTGAVLSNIADLNNDLLLVLYNYGARIFSNSWGGYTTSGYDTDALNLDTFMYNNPEALVLFANGNAGDPALTTTPCASTNGGSGYYCANSVVRPD